MRAMFGLVGLLVVCGIIIMIMKMGGHPADTVRRAEPVKRQVEQMAGVDSQGTRAQDSIRLDPFVVNGKLKYVLVEDVTAGGPMEAYYGLQRNDSIIEAMNMDLRDQDGEMAVALILDGYQRKAPLVVMRDGQKITLPQPASAKKPAKINLQNQLEGISAPRDVDGQ